MDIPARLQKHPDFEREGKEEFLRSTRLEGDWKERNLQMAGEGEREVHGFNRVDDDRAPARRECFFCFFPAAEPHIPREFGCFFKPDRNSIVSIGNIPFVSPKHDE